MFHIINPIVKTQMGDIAQLYNLLSKSAKGALQCINLYIKLGAITGRCGHSRPPIAISTDSPPWYMPREIWGELLDRLDIASLAALMRTCQFFRGIIWQKLSAQLLAAELANKSGFGEHVDTTKHIYDDENEETSEHRLVCVFEQSIWALRIVDCRVAIFAQETPLLLFKKIISSSWAEFGYYSDYDRTKYLERIFLKEITVERRSMIYDGWTLNLCKCCDKVSKIYEIYSYFSVYIEWPSCKLRGNSIDYKLTDGDSKIFGSVSLNRQVSGTVTPAICEKRILAANLREQTPKYEEFARLLEKLAI